LNEEVKIPFPIYSKSIAFHWTDCQKSLEFLPSLGSGFWLPLIPPRLNHGEGDSSVQFRFKEILDEAFAVVLHTRITMLLFADDHGKRAERINRTGFGHCG
jgi:hypothetical protein